MSLLFLIAGLYILNILKLDKILNIAGLYILNIKNLNLSVYHMSAVLSELVSFPLSDEGSQMLISGIFMQKEAFITLANSKAKGDITDTDFYRLA